MCSFDFKPQSSSFWSTINVYHFVKSDMHDILKRLIKRPSKSFAPLPVTAISLVLISEEGHRFLLKIIWYSIKELDAKVEDGCFHGFVSRLPARKNPTIHSRFSLTRLIYGSNFWGSKKNWFKYFPRLTLYLSSQSFIFSSTSNRQF